MTFLCTTCKMINYSDRLKISFASLGCSLFGQTIWQPEEQDKNCSADANLEHCIEIMPGIRLKSEHGFRFENSADAQQFVGDKMGKIFV